MVRRAALFAAAAVGSVQAQLRGRDVLITWFGAPACDAAAGPTSTVIVTQGVPQRVPNSANLPTYRITCGSAEGEAGSIQYCADVAGTDCPILTPFVPGACLSNDAPSFGSASYTITCPLPGDGEVLVPSLVSLDPSAFQITWFPAPGCGQQAGPNVDRSIVSAQQSLCHRVPNAPSAAGYRVDCASEGLNGTITFCSDFACAFCDTFTPFISEGCLANDADTLGSASYAVRCPVGAGPVVVSPEPQPLPATPSSLPFPGSTRISIGNLTFDIPIGVGVQTLPAGEGSPLVDVRISAEEGVQVFVTQPSLQDLVPGLTSLLPTGALPALAPLLAGGVVQEGPVEPDNGPADTPVQELPAEPDNRPGDTPVPNPSPAPSNMPFVGPPAAPGSLLSSLPAPDDFRITWFAEPACGLSAGSSFTGVVGPTGFCHAVPDSPDAGYRVHCATDDAGQLTGQGVLQVCQDSACSACNVAAPFTDEQCLPNPVEFGSLSVQLQCRNPLLPPTEPPANRAVVTWFELEGCAPEHRTLVDLTQGLCQTVPRGENGGYSVTCDADGLGGGVYAVCADTTCGNCSVSTAFSRDQCLPNPVAFGSASVAFRCPQAGAPPVQPIPPVPAATPLPSQGVPAPPAPTPNPGTSNPPAPQPPAPLPGLPVGPSSSPSSALPVPPAPLPVVGPRPDDVRVTWFEQEGCVYNGPPTDHFTGLLLPRTLCHVVPGNPRTGYAVYCNPDAGGGGVIQFCEDASCSSCNTSTPFEEEQCLPNPRAFGSQSVQLQCNNPLVPPQSPLPGRALTAWFEFPACDTTHRTLVDISTDICQTVPHGSVDAPANTGYRVECASDGSGVGFIQHCTSDTCGTCGTAIPFASDQCLPNLPGLGSLSYAIRCPSSVGYGGDMLFNGGSGDGGVAAVSSGPSLGSRGTLNGTRAPSVGTSGAEGASISVGAALMVAAVALAVSRAALL